jgi:hypothetical protein
MKSYLLLFLVLFAATIAPAQSGGTSSGESARGRSAFAGKTLENYQEIIAALPEDLRRSKAGKWSQVQRDEANAKLKEVFVPHLAHAKMRLKVTEIPDWDGWKFYSEIVKLDGCYIRVFGAFPRSAKAKLATLKKGDYATLEGTISSISYIDLWNTFTLSICLDDCTFER